MSQEHREGEDEVYTFRQAEGIFEEERPIGLRIQAPEARRALRGYVFHYIAAKLADEGILEDFPGSDVDVNLPIITRTLKQWHGLWAEALRELDERRG